MSGVNKVIIVGRLGKDPEVRHLESGASVANFPVATSEYYKDRNTGERREQTEWHNVVLWRGLADISEKYLNKGDMVYIEGKLRTRSWEKDGITRYTTEIVGDNMTMLSPKGSNEGGGNPASSSSAGGNSSYQQSSQPAADISMDDDTDDLPF
ncbi:single-stranded DNA-binding protein [Fulvivirga sediminis]|uniref:Single-stranded DNA-binding protein n=1 Tax=Fulvivirga sediminis TaxID=2803949 RepID=A0A937JZX6_9BACT|nr:single-stranded DNA-binding protein [Fulvivirga sediminis]MBL3657803.1 single-stranded DNA-binding protein [Fulvivirga sediminis]